jgi:hypothetical protein
VILSHVLEHVPDPVGFLGEVGQRLSDKGLVYAEVPGVLCLGQGYRGDILRYLTIAHLHHFTQRYLTALFASVGLELREGTETVCALYQSSRHTTPPAMEDEYARVARYLIRTELRYLCRAAHVLRAARSLASKAVRYVFSAGRG